ncbi:MarR family winged helix-turn-helix transcriptional regulator [Nonlabens agnitus]|uniref:MarR family transcriptional regulator n=1 Tax=Nonlabens agnitus TaxID=870484 RepID=A0A2S9WTJ1_9FLAO|nr:MarR family transcriptional regulator [Nonlabens agnitus]PRP66801.1 MarR family transcriptional regulator [Nonlabens agnitus]
MSQKSKSVPLSRKLVTSLIKKGTDMTEAIGSVLKEEKITIQQFNVLRILRGRHGKPASLQDVSKDMLHSNSNTTRVIDKLVLKKLVERIQCPEDRRQIELRITDEGLKLLEKLDTKVDAREKELTDALNASEIESILKLIDKI